VVSVKSEDMLREAADLLKIADNITIKLPTIREGVIACKKLSTQGVKVTMTLCFQPLQALIVAKGGGDVCQRRSSADSMTRPKRG